MNYSKLFVICVTLLMTLPIIQTTQEPNVNVKANPGDCCIPIATNFTKYVTQELSNIIRKKDVYNQSDPNELKKGRFFSSKGELKAAKMIEEWMNDNCSLATVKTEQIYDIPQWKIGIVERFIIHEDGNMNNLLNITYINLTIHNKNDPTNDTRIYDCYITPIWNETSKEYLTYLKHIKQPRDILSHNFTYTNLTISNNLSDTVLKNDDQYIFSFFENHTQEFANYTIAMAENMTYYLPEFWTDFFLPTYEDFYNFTFENITSNNNSTFPTYLRDLPQKTNDYLIIEENPVMNPTNTTTVYQNISNILINLTKESLEKIWKSKYIYHFIKDIKPGIITPNTPFYDGITNLSQGFTMYIVTYLNHIWRGIRSIICHDF